MSTAFNPASAKALAHEFWTSSIIDAIIVYAMIPNQSPAFDQYWASNGYMDRAVSLIADWATSQQELMPGLTVATLQLEGRTPVILMEIPGDPSLGTILMYGHCDKQPPMTEAWREGLHPYLPVTEHGRLYGRGTADDGYAPFAALAAVRIVQELGARHGRIVILIEAAEESGSPDLETYVEQFSDRIGTPDLVICLDSGCGTYDRLWLTTSLRGLVSGDLEVKVLTEGVHSGHASGIVPSSTIIAMHLLESIMDLETQEILLDELHNNDAPTQRVEDVRAVGELLGDGVFKEFPFVTGVKPGPYDREEYVTWTNAELLIKNTLGPALEIIGQSGIPAIGRDQIGNVMRPSTTMRLSMRIPPGVVPIEAFEAMREMLESHPPFGAEVHFTQVGGFAQGWDAPLLAPWLEASLRTASIEYFGEAMMSRGQGGSIPFMAMLGDKFPQAQFIVTGVLGPESNAHGPNEFLHLEYAERLTAVIAQVIADHAEREQS